MIERPDFDRDAAERVLRRAIDLADADPTHGDGISEQALLEAAEELGVDVAAVRRAATEERLGVLVPSEGPVDRVAGPALVTATRVVDGTAEAALERVDVWLRRSAAFRRRRLDQGGLVAHYTRRTDPAAGVQRFARSVSGKEDLGRVRRLRAVAQPIESDRSVLALVADLQVERSAAVAGGSSVAGIGSTVSVIEALAVTPWLWFGVPASVGLGLGLVRMRAAGVPDVALALDGVLDAVVAEDRPGGVLDDVRDRLRTGRTRPAPTTRPPEGRKRARGTSRSAGGPGPQQ